MNGCASKVSVIIPVYNTEKYLSFCLNSCLQQTLFDIEIICVNDGSTDNSLAILEEYAKRDYRVIIVNKENGGLSSARNAGLKVATGEIIMFLDSDDSIAENACERVWVEAKEGKYDILAFSAAYFPTQPEPDQWMKDRLHVRTSRRYGFEPDILFMNNGAKPFVWRQAFLKEFLDKHKLTFDETVKFGEDTVFDMEAYPLAWRFAFIEDALYNYRWARPDSLMATAAKDEDKKYADHLYMCEVITKFWNGHGWLKKYGDWYLDWLLDFMVYDIDNSKAKNKKELFARLNKLIVTYELDKNWYKSLSDSRKLLVDVMERGAGIEKAEAAKTKAAK